MTDRITALSAALNHLWLAQQAIDNGPTYDRLLDELDAEVTELARKVESYRHAEQVKNERAATHYDI